MKWSTRNGRHDWVGIVLCTAGVLSLFMALHAACAATGTDPRPVADAESGSPVASQKAAAP
ncbi:hypothetical protein ACV229_09095 [Burkholderia sp. MR1-5-21]